MQKRENFASQFGLIMAAVGSAVGLGNIWRFSYIVGINGGGAFLVVYLLCVVLVGLPVLIAELTIGRSSGLSSVSAFQKLAPRSFWWIVGVMGVLAATTIGCYYPTVAGWSLGYVFESMFDWNALVGDTGAAFTEFSAGWKAIVFAAAALAVTVVVLLRGVTAGIERCSKLLMPMLGVIMVVLVVRSLTLPGAMEGVRFLFAPDFTKLTVGGFLDALGHSFYSLSLGMGVMITYSSYMKKDTDLPSATVSIVTMDTAIAILAGLAIFPAVFAMGLDPGEGAGLAFVTLPAAFASMPFGQIFSILFFLLVFIAALTSLISILQVPLALLEDRFHFSVKKGLAVVSAVVIVFGVPSVLSFGPLAGFTILGMDYFTLMDRLANDIFLPVAGLLGILFILFSFGVAASKREFLTGSKRESHFLATIYPFAIRFIAPAAIIVILLRAALSFAQG
ncbi:MAG: sodium-dependent transporter [Clostridiales Family XIII bacterium]|jgi:NSS family neurotransmitter:Na+ symporter|nr:sodium-dependent transporter [Clostridiales Family XIII bacterium]